MKKSDYEVPEFNGEMCLISKHDLYIDRKYQRELKGIKQIHRLTTQFTWPKFVCCSVNLRGGRYYVMDGQRRVALAKLIGSVDYIPCILFKGLTRDQEAETFEDINLNRTRVNSIEIFHSRVNRKEHEAMNLNRFTKKHQWTIAKNSSPMYIMCIWQIQNALKGTHNFKAYGSVLDFMRDYHQGFCRAKLFKALMYTEHYLMQQDDTIHNYVSKLGSYKLCMSRIKEAEELCSNAIKVSTSVKIITDLINSGSKKKVIIELPKR